MKFIHLSDLHIGKRLMEVSFLEDQAYILAQILELLDKIRPDGVIIAGDVYDKAVPSAEAVALFDDFLTRLSLRNVQVFLISGNHDSPERIAFGSHLMANSGVHVSPVWDGTLSPVTLHDEFGEVNIFMLPFIKPSHVRRYFPDAKTDSYTDAIQTALSEISIDRTKRNLLITHQFITGASRCESEEVSVGGSDNVDVSVFDAFDYVALGHIHGPQKISRESVRYCGTPLKYSFSEASHKKSLSVVTMAEKGTILIDAVPLIPKRDLRCLKGSYDELTLRANYEGTNTEDYLHITLTDEDDIPDAMAKLRVIYPNLLRLEYDNRRTRASGSVESPDECASLSPMELFSRFYEMQNNQPLSDEQREFMNGLITKVWEGGM